MHVGLAPGWQHGVGDGRELPPGRGLDPGGGGGALGWAGGRARGEGASGERTGPPRPPPLHSRLHADVCRVHNHGVWSLWVAGRGCRRWCCRLAPRPPPTARAHTRRPRLAPRAHTPRPRHGQTGPQTRGAAHPRLPPWLRLHRAAWKGAPRPRAAVAPAWAPLLRPLRRRSLRAAAAALRHPRSACSSTA